MEKTLRDKIRELTAKHLKKYKSQVFGQNLLDVGYVDNTLPKIKKDIVELPMSDITDGGIVTGAALMNRQPIYIIRYQGYNWLNCIFIVNYACKSMELWKRSCKMLIRGICNEGSIGPVAGSSHISMLYRMPGIKIVSPFTIKEYQKAYRSFEKDNSVYYFSEHRKSFGLSKEITDYLPSNPDLIVILISVTRLEKKNILEKNKNKKIAIINLFQLKPFKLSSKIKNYISNSKCKILICDNDFEDGLISILSHKINTQFNKKIYGLGLQNKSAGHHPKYDNLPPNSEKITIKIREILKKK